MGIPILAAWTACFSGLVSSWGKATRRPRPAVELRYPNPPDKSLNLETVVLSWAYLIVSQKLKAMPAKSRKVYRADHFEHDLNRGKEAQVWQFLRNWREGAALVAAEQWRIFYETGRFDRFYSDKALSAKVGGVNICGDIRTQVVGILDSFMSNRANDFEKIIARSTLSKERKDSLYTINRRKAWFGQPSSPLTPDQLSAHILARQIMRQVLSQHRKPSYNHISAILGKNLVEIQASKALAVTKSEPSSLALSSPSVSPHSVTSPFPLWLSMSSPTKNHRVLIPLKDNTHYTQRAGTRCKAVQIIEKDNKLSFGLMTDQAAVFKLSRDHYEPKTEELSLDFGLRSMFATDKGDLVGRDFLIRLHKYDQKFTDLAAYRQRLGLKVRCSRYDKYVGQMREFLKNEINRVLNQLVAVHQPKHLVLERLNFQNPNLSKRLNRILQNCGRAIIRAKLKDLEDKYGITHLEVNPAYTSQTCSQEGCGYVDAKNRNGEKFICKFCKKGLHADVSGARTIKSRRSWPKGAIYTSKKTILQEQVKLFMERHLHMRPSSGPPDPRVDNPYFKEYHQVFKDKSKLGDVKYNQDK